MMKTILGFSLAWAAYDIVREVSPIAILFDRAVFMMSNWCESVDSYQGSSLPS